MNGDLISREALLKTSGLENAQEDGNKDAASTFFSYDFMLRYELADMIRNAPAVDAEPVRHGRWTFPWTSPECSVCKKTQKWTSKFCPNCGAKMDKEGE